MTKTVPRTRNYHDTSAATRVERFMLGEPLTELYPHWIASSSGQGKF